MGTVTDAYKSQTCQIKHGKTRLYFRYAPPHGRVEPVRQLPRK
ncbi:hypothetical protein VDGL01_00826 [Verticillium dahliae]